MISRMAGRGRAHLPLVHEAPQSARRIPFFAASTALRLRTIQQFLHQHAELEKTGKPISIEKYCKPTSRAFGYVYGLLGKLCGSRSFQDTVTDVGQEIGSALIAFDCAMDWEADQSTGDFNPIASREEVRDALEYSANCLLRGIPVSGGVR